MTRTRTIPLLSLCGAVLIWFSEGCTRKAVDENQESKRPNILFIAVDDLRPELGCYGAAHIHSPEIDRLASEAAVFERAYCNVPVCGASRASLLTGVRPTRYRFLNYSTWKDKDYPRGTSLPMLFRQYGYTTISNGKVYHHAEDDSAAWTEVWRPQPGYTGGWRDYRTPENIRLDTLPDTRGRPYEAVEGPDTLYFDGKIAQKSIADLKKLKEEGGPFFLAVGFMKPHLPFNAPTRYWNIYDSLRIHLPPNYIQPETTPARAFHNFGELRNYSDIPAEGPVSDAMARKLIHGYYACVSYTDAQVGKLLKAVQDLGLSDNTVVVLWGDHGWNLGDHQLWCKHCNFASSLHVPLLVKVPGMTAGGHISDIVEFIDIYPSLCELADLPAPSNLDGESFAGLMRGEQGNRGKDYAVSKWKDGITLINGTNFYTEWLDETNQVVDTMLFDHAFDPLELRNLAINPEYATLCGSLSLQLHKSWGADFLEKK